MRKTILGILIGLLILVVSGIAVAQPKGVSGRYFIGSNSGILRALTGVQHNFTNGYTTELTPGQLKSLERLTSRFDISIEEVPLYQIAGRPVCDDGICQGNEPKTCPQDCPSEPPPEPEPRICEPSNQIPWGVIKVNGGSGGAGVDVAVLDTGAYKDHLDLTGRIEQCKDFTKGPRVKNGCKDENGHGTHVAGTVLADGGSDGKGIFGVAPDANLLAYKVCGNDGSCWTDDIAAAINYAGSHGAEIVSMSLSGNTQSSLIKDAIDENPHVLFVAAAGNDGPKEGSIDYPGAYVKVISVGAINASETVPYWSSRGVNDGDYTIEEREVEFGAPGVSVESTYINGCYAYGDGTSMATPHVSGLAAKLWQGNADATRSYLASTVRDIWEIGDDIATGFGLPAAP